MGWGEELAFRDCPWCGLRDAQMRQITANAQISVPGKADRTWALVACPRCGGVVVLETNGPNESPPKVVRVVPTDDRTAAEVRFLPDDVARFYRDAQRVLDAGVPDAAAVQLRKTLEAAAGHFDVKERSLVGSIEKLIETGLVTKQFGDVLDRVRKVGNVGAHASDETVDQATAEQVMRFTTQVLRNLFEIPGEIRDIDETEAIMAELIAEAKAEEAGEPS